MSIPLKCGAQWQVVGSDNFNSLVGASPVGVVYSEWALADPAARSYLRPMLLENKGWQVFITTMRGKNHAYNTHQAALKDPSAFAQILKATDTGIFTPEQLAKERQAYMDDLGDELGIAMFNQEYMCSHEEAVLGAIYGNEIAAAEQFGRIKPVPYDPLLKVHRIWDLGYSDKMPCIMVQRSASEIRIIDHRAWRKTTIAECINQLKSLPYNWGIDYIPHDGANKDHKSGKTTEDILKALGCTVEVVDKWDVEEGIRAVRMMLPRCYFDAEKTHSLIHSLKNYRRRINKSGAAHASPFHDDQGFCDDADAMRYLAVVADTLSNNLRGKAPKLKYHSNQATSMSR
jgi:hypothetical protein